MVEVTVTLSNDQVDGVAERLQDYRERLAKEMTSAKDHPRVQSATITYTMLGRILSKLYGHQQNLEHQGKGRR